MLSLEHHCRLAGTCLIKIVHTADIHFGVENYGRIDSATGLHTRLLDFVKSFNICIDHAIKENADLFILAGDAYKTAIPSPTHQKYLLQSLLRLQKANIPIVIVVGNHDHPLSFGKAHALDVYAELPLSHFYVFSKPHAITIPTKNGPVQVVGIPWPLRQNLLTKEDFRYKDFEKITDHISTAVCEIIKKLALKLDPSIPAVLTGHLTVNNGIFSGSERRAVFGNDPLFTTQDLAIEPFNYVALGHLHRHQSLNDKNKTPVVYAGSIERIDFGEVRDTKGFVIAEIDTIKNAYNFERIADIRFVQLPTRKMLEINIVLEEHKDHFAKQIIDELKKYQIQNAIVKLFYHIPPGCMDTVDISLIHKHLSEAWFVAGIIPIHKPLSKGSRNDSTHNHHLSNQELLEKYFNNKGFSSEKTKELTTKACCILDQSKIISSE